MKNLILILILFLFNCSIEPEKTGHIQWKDIIGTTWTMEEQLNDVQSCQMSFTFLSDTLYLLKCYFDINTHSIEDKKYMKGRVFNKRYVEDSNGDIDLFFTWARKHYADDLYTVPVEGYDIIDDWFLYEIDKNNHLLMGIVNPPNICYYWTLERG